MNRRPKTIGFWCGRLPHWEVEGGRYFVTIHLAGSIPIQGRQRLRQLAEQLRDMPQQNSDGDRLRLQRRIFQEMELWLDRSEWNPHLRHSEIAGVVADAIEHRQQRGDWRVFEYVVMPTHAHLFCEVASGGLKQVMEDFKRWTGHQAATYLGGEGERFWQREWFDHWSRSDEEDERIVAYIRNNPVKAGLVQQSEQWPHASWSRR
jgi:REP element-mobilizing transposase RayT